MTRSRPALLCLALLCGLVASAVALPAVDDASFESRVLASDKAWVLEFSSPRCGTCQELAPLYAAVAGRLGGSAQFGEVDIDTDGGMALAKRLGVLEEGVPNVRAWARRDAPMGGDRVFSGWELPTEAELERSVVAALAPAVRCDKTFWGRAR
jgi:thiol-disulfide isomerase/thioredoxin